MKIIDRWLHDRQLRRIQKKAGTICEQGASNAPFPPLDAAISGNNPADHLSHLAHLASANIGLTARPVQIQAALALIEGSIAEMQTGEGKSLVAILSSGALAMSGRRVHVMTVNDYLVCRDAEFARKAIEGTGVRVGAITKDMDLEDKKEIYRQCSIIYGTPSAFAFDHLRDSMRRSDDDFRQCFPLDAVIVDEVDSILIDEAKMPLIISGKSAHDVDHLPDLIRILKSLRCEKGHSSKILGSTADVYYMEDRGKSVLMDSGYQLLESYLQESGLVEKGRSLYQSGYAGLLADVDNCLQAIYHYRAGRDYLVQDDEVIIINTSTGRQEPGKRWSGGLHQAVEALEGVEIQNDSKPQSRITMQSFIRLYRHRCGMTGTASTDAQEFMETYGLRVLSIPLHQQSRKFIDDDRLFLTKQEKDAAIVADIERCYSSGQPVLACVPNVIEGESLSASLKARNIRHNLLTAKHHDREAEVISEAGRIGSVTIATNMAGRGTDILIGGSSPAGDTESHDRWASERSHLMSLGGLRVIGTCRHESRRIDLQLQGRSGRQGEPGSTVFYLSLEDSLFTQLDDFTRSFLSRLIYHHGTEERGLSHPSVTKAVANCQNLIQSGYKDQRASLESVESFNEMQRQAFLSIRESWLAHPEPDRHLSMIAKGHVQKLAYDIVTQNGFGVAASQLSQILSKRWGLAFDLSDAVRQSTSTDFVNSVLEEVSHVLDRIVFTESSRDLIRSCMVTVMDELWADHLELADHTQKSVQWRVFAQKKPAQEYAREIDEAFLDMLKETSLLAIDRSVPMVFEQISNSLDHKETFA